MVRPRLLSITDDTEMGFAISGGGIEIFLQSMGCILAWRDVGLPKPKQIAATSGGVFAGVAMVLGREDETLEMILDVDFQSDQIFTKVPWREVPLKGFHQSVLGEHIERHLGDLLELSAEICRRSATTDMIVVAAPLRRSAGLVRGSNRRPFEEHFRASECDPQTMLDAIWASSAMPSAYPYILDGRPYIDGGFSRWYPLGLACKGVDLGIGFCYQIDIPKFSDSMLVPQLRRWLGVTARIPKIRDILDEMENRGKANLPPTYFDVYMRIIKAHIWRDMEIEETWAVRQESQRDMLRQIAEETGMPGIVQKAMLEHAPHLEQIAPHRSIFTSASDADLNISLRKSRPWTVAQKQSVVDHGYQQTITMFSEWGIV